MKRILVVELWNIGDVILTLPFLAQLRSVFPEAEITLLGRPHAGEVLAGTGLVDHFIEANLTWKKGDRPFEPVPYDWGGLLRAVRALRKQKFDLAFHCRPHIREYVLLALSGARRRIGYARPGWDRSLTDAISFDRPDLQKKDEWLRLLEPFGGSRQIETPRLQVSGDERKWASGFLETNGAESASRLVGLHAGASISEKRWPIERFGEVARDLAILADVRVLAFVEPEGYGAPLGLIDGVITARVGLRQMLALLERCDLLVCNDSGPMHVAGALGVPTVAVFGAGIDRRFAPLGDQHELVVADPRGVGAVVTGELFAPYADVAMVPTTRVMEAVRRVLGRAMANGARARQARILLNHGRR